jgi:hypothetical protein
MGQQHGRRNYDPGKGQERNSQNDKGYKHLDKGESLLLFDASEQ